jgi:putative CocE/NonD family hydrolase
VTLYLDSDGNANTRKGDGRLVADVPSKEGKDLYVYDPLKPTPTVGGAVCCFDAAVGGAFDQSDVELRADVLVYDSERLTAPLEVTGKIEVSLYLSSDVKDTDLLVKLIDVAPDGRAFNLDEGVMRVRWRQGFDAPVFMSSGEVYEIRFPPLVTSNVFKRGHRVRIAVSSSSFPHYERNLNTGGANFNESVPMIAHNVIHHGPRFRSKITLPLIDLIRPGVQNAVSQ